MAKFSTLILSAFAVIFASASFAGDSTDPAAPRKEFRQRRDYPFTFEAVSYLAVEGPKPMRFAEAQPECGNHDAPPLPAPKPTPEKKVAVTASGDSKKTETQKAMSTTNPPAFPPPANAPSVGGPDLTKMPDDVMTYFKNPYNAGPRGEHLFDPIFEPGMSQGPPSKATYHLQDKQDKP
jgi:hypothetical protein